MTSILWPVVSRLSPKSWLRVFTVFPILLVFFFRAHSTFEYRRYTETPRLFSGDEPKYLRMVQSLAEDGDLDISNSWGSEEDIAGMREKSAARGTRRFGHLYVFGKNRGIYSLHLPGTAVLIYPGYLADLLRHPPNSTRSPKKLPFLPGRLFFTRLSLLILSMASLLLLYRLLSWLFQSLLLTTFLLLLLVLNSPFCRIGLQIYPDGPALFFLLVALNAVWRPFRDRKLSDFLLIFSLAFLPWLHQRFILLSLAIYGVFVIGLWRKPKRFPLQRFLVISGALLVLSLPYFYYFYSITGSPSPLSLGQVYGETFIRLAILPLGFFGQAFSTKEGLLWIYPWTFFSLAGIFWGLKSDRRLSLELLAVFFPYYLACSAAFPWTGASSPAGRFMVPLLPVCLIFAGFAWRDLLRTHSWKKWLFYLLFLAIVLLNRYFPLAHLEFGYTRVKPADLSLMLLTGIFLVLLYGFFSLGERKKWI
jgi:hypothetical protein